MCIALLMQLVFSISALTFFISQTTLQGELLSMMAGQEFEPGLSSDPPTPGPLKTGSEVIGGLQDRGKCSLGGSRSKGGGGERRPTQAHHPSFLLIEKSHKSKFYTTPHAMPNVEIAAKIGP